MSRMGMMLFVLLVAAAAAFVSLGEETLDDHEVFVSVTAREMIGSHDYMIPTFNGQYRLNKTPLPYWLIVAAERLTGRIDEFTTRMPTAILSVLSAGCILYFVTALVDFRTAFLASLVWTCSLGYIRYSHCARPEMALTFFTLMSFLSFYAAVEEPDRRRQICYALVFWVSLALSVLAKAPSSLFFVPLTALAYAAVFKRWRSLSKIYPLWGIPLFLLIVLPWPLAAAHAMHWDMTLWKEESVRRFTAPVTTGDHSWFYYVGRTCIMMLPWAAFLPYAVTAPFFKIWRDKQRVMGYLWISLVSGVLFLTLCSGKRQHYILPLMPPLAILVGIVMEDMLFGHTVFRPAERLGFLKAHAWAFLLAGAAAAALAFEPVYMYTDRLVRWASSAITVNGVFLPAYSASLGRYGMAVGVALVWGTSGGVMFHTKRRPTAACIAVFAAVAAVIVLACSFAPAMQADEDRPIAEFARQVREVVPAGDDLFAHGKPDPVFVHYFGRALKTLPEADVQSLYADGGWIFAAGEDIEPFGKKHCLKEVAVSRYQREGELREMRVFHRTGG